MGNAATKSDTATGRPGRRKRKTKWDFKRSDISQIRSLELSGMSKTEISKVMGIPRTTINSFLKRSRADIWRSPGRKKVWINIKQGFTIGEMLKSGSTVKSISESVDVKYTTVMDKIKSDENWNKYPLTIGRREIKVTVRMVNVVEQSSMYGVPIRIMASACGVSYEWLRSRLSDPEPNDLNRAYVSGYIKRRSLIVKFCHKVFKACNDGDIPLTQSVVELMKWYDLNVCGIGKSQTKRQKAKDEKFCWSLAIGNVLPEHRIELNKPRRKPKNSRRIVKH